MRFGSRAPGRAGIDSYGVKPAAPVDPKHVAELIALLDSDQYKVREKATSDLLKIGERIVSAIDTALAKQPPLETKKRLEDLRTKTTGAVLQGERLRDFRGVELLEQIGTPAARQLLQGLAQGDPEALVTSSAARRSSGWVAGSEGRRDFVLTRSQFGSGSC